jgi:Resolvase, N terminal domain
MKPVVPRPQRCAIYTRKSTEHNLDLEFNSLDAQREACEAYIKSQGHEGWRLVPDHYDDGGLSGASLVRRLRPPRPLGMNPLAQKHWPRWRRTFRRNKSPVCWARHSPPPRPLG